MHDFLFSPDDDPIDPIGDPEQNDFDSGQETPLRDVSGLFNERGFYKSNGFSFNDEEIINDFNGNLIYNIPLYNYKLAGDLSLDIKLVYNGSVSHSIKIANATNLNTGLKNTYNMNMPEWILSVNGVCIQTFNFITKYFSKPTFPATNLEGYDINMQIPGYHSSNDLRVYSTNSDTIALLMGDGSTITLENIINSVEEEARYIGDYRGKGKENYIKAKVEYLQDPEPYPYYRARKIKLLKGDGLEYVFNEVKNQFEDFTQYISLRQKPMMPLLMEINDRFGNWIKFEYSSSYNVGSGRPIISNIHTSGVNSHQNSFDFEFLFGQGGLFIEHQTNLNKGYTIRFQDGGVNYLPSTSGNKIGRVKKITNCLNQTFEIDYNTNASDLNYTRSYTGVYNPFTNGNFTVNFNKLNRIRKIKNFLGLCRSYDYIGSLSQQINVQFLYYEDPGNILSNDFRGYGRDPFFTNMLLKKLEYYIDVNVIEKSETIYSYIFEKVNTINGQPRNLSHHPIYEGDVLKTDKTITSKDDLTINSSLSSIKTTLEYKIYPLYDPNNNFAFLPDVDGVTKLIQETIESNTAAEIFKTSNFEYSIGVGDPLTGGYNGSFLSKKRIENFKNIIKSWEWDYVHKNNNVNEFVIVSKEKDPFGALKIKKYKDFSISFNRIQFTNAFDSSANPQILFNYFSYNIIEEEYIEFISNPGFKSNYKKYIFIETINDSRGYIGQLLKEELYENNSVNKIETLYLYCKNDRTGESIFQISNSFPFKEGNLKEIAKPNGQITKYYYHPISIDEVIITDEPQNVPFLKYLVKYNNNTTVEKSDKIWDHRLPIRIDNVKRILNNDLSLLTSYNSYTPDGSPEKKIGYQKFLTEFEYSTIHRIKKITLPGDFSLLPDEILISTIHNYEQVEKIITSIKWGSFRILSNQYIGSFTQNINEINDPTSCRPFITKYNALEPSATYLNAFIGFDKNEFKNISVLERAQLIIRPLQYDMSVDGIAVTDKKIRIKPVNTLQQKIQSSIYCPNQLEYYFSLTNYDKQFSLNIPGLYPSCNFSNNVSLDIKDLILHSSTNNIDFLGVVIYPQFPNIIPASPIEPIDPLDTQNPYYAQLLMTLCSNFSDINIQNDWLQNYSPRIDLKGIIDYPVYIPKTIFKSGTIGYEYDDHNKEINIYSIRNTVSFDTSRLKYYLDIYGNIKRKDIIIEETIPNPVYDSHLSFFNFLNKPSKNNDGAGNETKYSYDGLQRLIRTDNADGSFTTTSFFYQVSISGYYFGSVPGSFIEKQIFTDENGNNFEKYYDTLGNLRREVKFLSSVIPVEEGVEEPIEEGDAPPIQLITDYLYDSLNRLIKVKTPEGKIIEYQYDGYGRQNKRITVDSGIIEFQYDSNNNLITSQDANQSSIASYIFTFRKYDALNRLTVLGENSRDRGDFIDFNADEDFDFTVGDSPDPYYDYLIVNVYDDLSTASASIFTSPSDYIPTSQNYNYFTKGRLVATAYRTRKTDLWNFKYFRYDERGRVKTMWHLLNGLETKKIEYNYNSQDQITSFDIINSVNDFKRFRYYYDKPGRVNKLSLYTGDPFQDDPFGYFNLVRYGYNSNSLVSYISMQNETIKNSYIYNERNWLQNCNSREGVLSYDMFSFPNGNVQSLNYFGTYKNNFNPLTNLEYEFSYDKSNRLLTANCASFSGNGYDVNNSYDKDGNILTLKRYRYDGVIKDDFYYTYYSGTNKLKKVTNQMQDFLYDNNGNLIKDDLNKNFEIKYDHRNLITFIKHLVYGMEGEVYTLAIYYYYDDAGNRIRKIILQSYITKPYISDTPDDDLTNYPDYDEEVFEKEAEEYYKEELDNPTMWFLVSNEFYLRSLDGKELALFKGSNIERYNLWGRDNEGYIKADDTKYYYLKDHLGSIRVILDQNKNIESAQDYDMWGMIKDGRSFDSYKGKYKFTGKERDSESNYDYFGARFYDARIGRWGSEEPLIDRYPQRSSYLYSNNNPISRLDLKGLDDFYYLNGNAMAKNGYVNTGSDNNRYFVQNDSGNYTYEGKNYFQANSYHTVESHESNVRYNKMDVNFQSDLYQKAFNDSLPDSFIDKAFLKAVPGAKEKYMLEQSLRGKMDQKTRTISDQSSLYVFNNTAFNRNEAGNIVWGAVMAFLGFSLSETISYAQAYSMLSQGRSDEKEELNAIKEGWKYQDEK